MSNERERTRHGDVRDRTRNGVDASVSRRDFVKTSAAAGAGALALGGSSNAAAQSVVDTLQEGDMASVPQTQYFNVFNNQWSNDSADQTVYTYDDGSFGWEFSGGSGNINYPEVFGGHRPWGTDTGIPELSNVTLGDVEELTFSFDVDIDVEGNGHYNLAEEFWLLDGQPGPDGSAITHEVMVLCDWGGGHVEDHSPFVEHDVWEDQFGNTIDYWDRTIGGTDDDFLIFGVSTSQTTGKIDLKPVVDYIVEEENATEGHRMSAIELGTETFDGPTGEVHFEHFGVTINGSTYTCGPGESPDPEPEPPASPANLVTNEVTESTIDVGWESASNANHYNVYRDGTQVGEPSGTAYTLTGLSPETTYTVGVEAENGDATSSVTETEVTTESDGTTTPACDDAAGGSAEVDGQTVCDVNDDSYYRDVTGDSEVGQGDVAEFFTKQHRSAWKQPDMFDFSENGAVTHGDVVELFDYVALN